MEEGTFNTSDLGLCDWQYTIRHHDTLSFVRGQKVFLKSSSALEMVVHDIIGDKIITRWKNVHNCLQYHSFPPECILQYRYAGLVTFRKTFSVCLN